MNTTYSTATIAQQRRNHLQAKAETQRQFRQLRQARRLRAATAAPTLDHDGGSRRPSIRFAFAHRPASV